MALKLIAQLLLERCPHCGVDRPTLQSQQPFHTENVQKGNPRDWMPYACSRCGGAVIASAAKVNHDVQEIYPRPSDVDSSVPDRPRAYLMQALDSRSAPAGAIMLAASAVDSMLKVKGYKDGSLYSRIEKASKDNLITEDMAKWAHDIRLDANDQRHADQAATLPTPEDATRTIDFALALAQFLFILPARVQRGLQAGSQ